MTRRRLASGNNAQFPQSEGLRGTHPMRAELCRVCRNPTGDTIKVKPPYYSAVGKRCDDCKGQAGVMGYDERDLQAQVLRRGDGQGPYRS